MSPTALRTFTVMITSLFAAPAAAQIPISGDLFDVRYYVTDEQSQRVRAMDDADRDGFLNQARCECGQSVQVEVKADAVQADTTKIVQTYLGIACAMAEDIPFGQFKRCTKLSASTYPLFVKPGVVANVHPVWLTNGVDPKSGDNRNPMTAIATGSCANLQGEAGAWICVQTNTTAGCQSDEFILDPETREAASLRYDYLPPTFLPDELTIEAASGGARLSWQVSQPGDIEGYRVLCEEAATGAAPHADFGAPSRTAANDRKHYYTAYNLCGEQPFSTVKLAPREDATCGDSIVDPGEACDDGEDNRDDGLCTTTCELAVSPALYGLDWGLMCSAHVAWNGTEAVLEGLENGKTYNVVLVTHDKFGNPRAFPQVLQVTPDSSLPSLSGDDAGCGCSSTTPTTGMLLLLPLLAASRRRRR